MTDQESSEVVPEEDISPGEPPPQPEVKQGVEASVWRIGPDGVTITSMIERHIDFFVANDPTSIFFYAELGESSQLKNDEETVQKVFQALAGVGLSEGQIINAVNQMQNAGILFRERAI